MSWWALAALGFVLGLTLGRKIAWLWLWSGLLGAFAFALASFVLDSKSSFLIGARVSRLLNLPGPFELYFVMGFIAFVTASLWCEAGRRLRI